ncbi:hypothetical protein ANN_21410 [Periplaneta americana]|uniref:Uncharacterized protein n=1 Tax=Periplaneta americana TaxID=6978 RepID=A0ABQ8SGE2_PERAM|nr:hypothetical protein ANN_21410 [Periplaneta americana]
MLKKLISLQRTVVRRGAKWIDVFQRPLKVDPLKYFIVKCAMSSPLGGNGQNIRCLHTCELRMKSEDRREMLASLPAKDEGTEGEKGVDIDTSFQSLEDLYPDENTPTRLFDGIPFRDVPICDIKASKNNTIITLSTAKGRFFWEY